MRINKFFTENGICSRREADRWVEAGRVSINGTLAKPGDQVQDGDQVAVDGKPLKLKKKRPVVLAYHKPVGVECTADPDVQNNIIQAVRYHERVFTIGRLDVMSEGLILLTNIGELADQISKARNQHEKEYEVSFYEGISDAQIQHLRKGVDIGDEERGLTLPCTVTRMDAQQIKIILKEGRNRQIRRMAEAIGLQIARLRRVRVLSIHLGDLPKDRWRELTPTEVDKLLQSFEKPA